MLALANIQVLQMKLYAFDLKYHPEKGFREIHFINSIGATRGITIGLKISSHNQVSTKKYEKIRRSCIIPDPNFCGMQNFVLN